MCFQAKKNGKDRIGYILSEDNSTPILVKNLNYKENFILFFIIKLKQHGLKIIG